VKVRLRHAHFTVYLYFPENAATQASAKVS